MGKSASVARRLFTVDDYHRMGEAGVFGPEDRVELLEGEIIAMSPIGDRHAACVNRMTQLFSNRVGKLAIVAVQNPVRLNRQSEPEPDVALLRPRADFYGGGTPTPKDVLLLVEAMDTTHEYDRGEKIPAYAKAAVVEVWLVDLPGQAVEVYREPGADAYGRVQSFGRGQTLVPSMFPDMRIAVDDILG